MAKFGEIKKIKFINKDDSISVKCISCRMKGFQRSVSYQLTDLLTD